MRSLLTACLLTLCLGGLHAAGSGEIGVLDLHAFFQSANLHMEPFEEITTEKGEIEERISKLEEEQRQRKDDLSGLSPSDPRFLQLRIQYEQAAVQLELLKKHAIERINRRMTDTLKNSFETVKAYLPGFARDHGLRLVHLAPTPDVLANDFNNLNLEIGLQTVLYYDPALDITEDFIAYANVRYAKEQRESAAAEEAAANEAAAEEEAGAAEDGSGDAGNRLILEGGE